jgi:archaemetzincin
MKGKNTLNGEEFFLLKAVDADRNKILGRILSSIYLRVLPIRLIQSKKTPMHRHHFLKAILFLALTQVSCTGTDQSPETKTVSKAPPPSTVIKVLPLGNLDKKLAEGAVFRLKQYVRHVTLLPAVALPAHAYYAPRNRYRADTLIKWMAAKAGRGEVYVGLTASDISTKKDKVKDFGVMGLGYMPGRACVVSSYRLKNKANFYKVVLHEAAHTTGLPHCPEKTCYLRDAKGGDPTGEETGFCSKCESFLKGKGWSF